MKRIFRHVIFIFLITRMPLYKFLSLNWQRTCCCCSLLASEKMIFLLNVKLTRKCNDNEGIFQYSIFFHLILGNMTHNWIKVCLNAMRRRSVWIWKYGIVEIGNKLMKGFSFLICSSASPGCCLFFNNDNVNVEVCRVRMAYGTFCVNKKLLELSCI